MVFPFESCGFFKNTLFRHPNRLVVQYIAFADQWFGQMAITKIWWRDPIFLYQSVSFRSSLCHVDHSTCKTLFDDGIEDPMLLVFPCGECVNSSWPILYHPAHTSSLCVQPWCGVAIFEEVSNSIFRQELSISQCVFMSWISVMSCHENIHEFTPNRWSIMVISEETYHKISTFWGW